MNTQHNYTDHLGNIRLQYAKMDGLRIMEEDNYYPFGLKHARYNQSMLVCMRKPISGKKTTRMVYSERSYKYKYNGKELQEEFGLNVYDYDVRVYEPAAPHFWQIDPMAEEYYDTSPYVYVANNPIVYTDPDGQNIVFGFETDKDGKRKGEDAVKNNINSGLGGGDFAQIDSDGNLSINISDKQRKNLTKEQTSFLGTLEKGINLTDSDGNSLDVNIGVETGTEEFFVGDFIGSRIDITDVNAFGDNEVRNKSDVLQFELSEQIDKTENNLDSSREGHKPAHSRAKILLMKKKGNLRVSEPKFKGKNALRKTTVDFADNKTGAISTIKIKSKKNKIKKVE